MRGWRDDGEKNGWIGVDVNELGEGVGEWWGEVDEEKKWEEIWVKPGGKKRKKAKRRGEKKWRKEKRRKEKKEEKGGG